MLRSSSSSLGLAFFPLPDSPLPLAFFFSGLAVTSSMVTPEVEPLSSRFWFERCSIRSVPIALENIFSKVSSMLVFVLSRMSALSCSTSAARSVRAAASRSLAASSAAAASAAICAFSRAASTRASSARSAAAISAASI